MTVKVAHKHAHVQRLVSVVKMATILEECITEEQRSVVRFFCGQNDSIQRIFTKKCVLFVVEYVCSVQYSTNGSINLPSWLQTFR
jgi:hypothetical protein